MIPPVISRCRLLADSLQAGIATAAFGIPRYVPAADVNYKYGVLE